MKQFLSYAGIGIASTGVEYAFYLAVLFLMGDHPHAIYWGVVAGFLSSVFFSFLCNQFWVFRCQKGETRNFFLTLGKTYLMYFGTGILLKEALIWLFVEKLSVSQWVAPLILVLLIFPLNFLLSKFWAFQPQKKGKEEIL